MWDLAISDLIGGLALAAFLSLPFGMVVGLVAEVAKPPGKYDPNGPLITTENIKQSLLAAVVFVALFTLPVAFMFQKDRVAADSWQVYARDNQCVAVNKRTAFSTTFNPATKTSQTSSHTEYLWRCKNGDEYWRR